MATHVNGTSSEVSAEMVGHAFVGQFYTILHEKPEMVHKFFQDSSMMSRPGPDGALMTVSTMKGINDLILSCNCQDYKAEILTADAQASHMKGVTVLVTGCLTGQDNATRKFTESFFLAPQDPGYFVLNNAFRFVEHDNLGQVNPMKKVCDANVSADPVVPVQETVEVPENSVENSVAVAEVSIENNKVVSDPSENQQKEVVVETATPQLPVVEPTHIAQPAVEALSNGYVDSSKKSYASLLRGLKNGATPTMVHTPTSAPKAVNANAAQPSVASPAGQHVHVAVPVTVSESTAPNGNGSTSSTDQAQGEGYSVYIGDLPWNATTELVEQEFKKFGHIKRNGIQVRSNKGFCFGFVEYEDASAKQKAIEMGTIQIGGKDVFIQEKKTTTRVVNGVSTHLFGRGGFRNDGGYRGGRGNYSNGRGYGRNNYSKRNVEVPSRGNNRNGDGYQNVYQNGRGRSGQQGESGAPK